MGGTMGSASAEWLRGGRGRSAFLMGYLRGLRHGAIAGAVLALLYAPESGATLRRRVSRWMGQAEAMDSAAPAAPVTPRRRTAGGTESRARRP